MSETDTGPDLSEPGTAAPGEDPHVANLTLWSRVERTDPAFTREMNGSFAGTAISPSWLVRRATEQFGPLGIGWGYDIVEEKFLDGAPLGVDANGVTHGVARVHILRLRLWYVWQGKRGQFEHFGQTPFVGRSPSGLATDGDVCKKSLTDALSKCLSMLGFGADVHMGLYDDLKYVEKVGREYSEAYQAAAAMGSAASRTGAAEPKSRPSRARKAEPGNSSEPAGPPGQGTGAAEGAAPPPPAASPSVPAWLRRVKTLGLDGIEHARKCVQETFAGEDLRKLEEALDERLSALTGSSAT